MPANLRSVNETADLTKQPVFANLKLLHRQLEERARKNQQPDHMHRVKTVEKGPVLIIRGK
jgi:hypothetical protein